MSDPWYSLDHLPPGRLRNIGAIWYVHGLPQWMTLAREPSGRQWQWWQIIEATRDSLADVKLVPPRGRAGIGWDEAPHCWRPLSPGWIWPGGKEPAPLAPHQVPRVVSQRYLSQAVADAEDAELAAEIRHDRAEAQLRDRDGPADTLDRWWRNPAAIRYEPAGQVSLRMAEGRVLRAMAHAGPSHQNYTLFSMTTAALLAKLAEGRELIERDLERVNRGLLDRFAPTQDDHTDFMTAMEWVAALYDPGAAGAHHGLSIWQEVLCWCASDLPLSWETVAIHMRMPADRVVNVYQAAIEAAHRVANGERAWRWTRRDPMAELRERNRAYRRQSA